MTHSFYLNEKEEASFQKLLSNHSSPSASAFIKRCIFRRRIRRNTLPVTGSDLQFYGTMSNLIDSLMNSHNEGEELTQDLLQLKELVNSKLDSI